MITERRILIHQNETFFRRSSSDWSPFLCSKCNITPIISSVKRWVLIFCELFVNSMSHAKWWKERPYMWCLEIHNTNVSQRISYPVIPHTDIILFRSFLDILCSCSSLLEQKKRREPHFYDSRLTLHLFNFNIVPKILSLWESLVFRHPTPESLYPQSEIHQSLP